MNEHTDTVRREFARQAPTFEDPDYGFADPRLMAWIKSNVPADGCSAVLDVAGGTGHMARAYAATAAVAVVLDTTVEMLAVGHRQAQAAGQRNVVFVRGDAANMNLVDGSFDLVMSRFAVHHFERPEQQIGEMARVCAPGGRVAIVDLVPLDDALGPEQDRLERMRDPSHTRALPMAELRSLLERAGVRVFHETFHDHRLPLERWLAQASTPPDVSASIRTTVRNHLDVGGASPMRPLIHEGELHVTHRYAILVGRAA